MVKRSKVSKLVKLGALWVRRKGLKRGITVVTRVGKLKGICQTKWEQGLVKCQDISAFFIRIRCGNRVNRENDCCINRVEGLRKSKSKIVRKAVKFVF